MLEAVVDVASLMMKLKHPFGSVQESVMCLNQRLLISQVRRIFDDFVKYWLILFKLLLSQIIVLPLEHQRFDFLRRIVVLLLLLVLAEELGRGESDLFGSLFIDPLLFIFEFFNVVSLSSEELWQVALQLFYLHGRLGLGNLLNTLQVSVHI